LLAQIEDWRASMEVEMSSQRARDALVRKAHKGLNVGGIIFGYDNYWRYPDGQEIQAIPGESKPENCTTIFKINPEQANTIVNIYRMYADGYGLAVIAKTLNGDPKHTDKLKTYFDGITQASPRKGSQSWAPSSVRGTTL
jgi:DNA invertase Pin-like site-specific DNA recombinase